MYACLFHFSPWTLHYFLSLIWVPCRNVLGFIYFFFLVLTHEPSMFPVVLKKARGCV